MSDLRIAARDRRALAIGMLLVLPVLLWRGAVQPYRESLAQTRERVDAARELLAREKAVQRDAPQLPALAAATLQRAADEAPRLFGGADTVAATAALAAWVRAAALGAGLRNAQASAAAVDHVALGVQAVGVDLRAEGSFAAVTAWIGLMESGERLLRVERLEVSGGAEGTVSVGARVLGYTAPFGTVRSSRR